MKFLYSYGYPMSGERTKKNTLATDKVGDYLYFGISRCNFIEKDTFSKKEGRKFAIEKLEEAKALYPAPFSGFSLDCNGMLGYCHKSMKSLLEEYFCFIDEHMWHTKIMPLIKKQKKK